MQSANEKTWNSRQKKGVPKEWVEAPIPEWIRPNFRLVPPYLTANSLTGPARNIAVAVVVAVHIKDALSLSLDDPPRIQVHLKCSKMRPAATWKKPLKTVASLRRISRIISFFIAQWATRRKKPPSWRETEHIKRPNVPWPSRDYPVAWCPFFITFQGCLQLPLAVFSPMYSAGRPPVCLGGA